MAYEDGLETVILDYAGKKGKTFFPGLVFASGTIDAEIVKADALVLALDAIQEGELNFTGVRYFTGVETKAAASAQNAQVERCFTITYQDDVTLEVFKKRLRIANLARLSNNSPVCPHDAAFDALQTDWQGVVKSKAGNDTTILDITQTGSSAFAE